MAEGPDGNSVHADLGDRFCAPVDRNQCIGTGSQTHSGHAASLQALVQHVALEVQVGGQHLDPGVASVHDVHKVPGAEGEAAGLHEALLLDPLGAEAKDGGVVLGYVKEQRAVLDRPIKYFHLKNNKIYFFHVLMKRMLLTSLRYKNNYLTGGILRANKKTYDFNVVFVNNIQFFISVSNMFLLLRF